MGSPVEELQTKVTRLADEYEEKIAYLTEKEQKQANKVRSVTNDHALLKAESQNLYLKVQVLERKTQETANLENAFLELQKDYDQLIKEKSAIIQNYENKIFYLKDEGKEAKGSVMDQQKATIRVKKEADEWQREWHQLNREKNKLEKENGDLLMELVKKDKSLDEKSKKIEEYTAEIASINKKILEFNILMERLIQENQRLNLLAGESGRETRLTVQERRVLERAKSGTLERDPSLKMSCTMKNFRGETNC